LGRSQASTAHHVISERVAKEMRVYRRCDARLLPDANHEVPERV
jgi:hypothetical protein